MEFKKDYPLYIDVIKQNRFNKAIKIQKLIST